jgi:hypothetical protein
MSDQTTREIAIELYVKELTNKLNVVNVNMDLLNKIVDKLRIAALNITEDAALVSGKDETELKRVVKNLLVDDLDLDYGDETDAILTSAIEKYGISNPLKYRVPLYYIIITDLNKVDDYMSL